LRKIGGYYREKRLRKLDVVFKKKTRF